MGFLKSIFTPFEKVSKSTSLVISLFWIIGFLLYWIIVSSGNKHLFPSPLQVVEGFKNLYSEGLLYHVSQSLLLCFKSAAISLAITLSIVYLSPMPLLQPIGNILSKLRFLPLTGITFYIAMLINDARSMQIWVLVIFMSLFFITSLLAILADIPQEEFDHAKTLKCSRWETLWEVVIKGRIDYVFDILRQNLAIVWMMLVSVESILVAAGGLGVLIKNSDKFMNHGRIVALQIVILLIGISLDFGLNTLRKSLFRYSTF
jgi:ABC-type nitrate/sulfonate/bicarbonate transport system permease component